MGNQADQVWDRLVRTWPNFPSIPLAVSPTWPWTGATTTQGFLANRWLRRDGDVYGGNPSLPPEVLSSFFILPMPTVVGAIVGGCGVVGNPTSWEIAADNPDGYWAISNRGLITVAALGMFDDVIYEIGVVARNVYGASAVTPIYIRPTVSGVGLLIAGGEDAGAKVSTSSGEPRS